MALKQQSRLLAMDTALGADKLGVRSITVQEQLSRLFQFEAELSSEDGMVDFDQVVGHNATIRLELAAKATRYFNGYVSRFVQVANQGRYAHYRATLVPWLWFLTRAADCRIFQNKKVPDILEDVFKAHGFTDYKLSLTETHPTREYCVQYRETDFNFVSRLMEQEGIYYFFTHEDGKHTLVLADSISAHNPFKGYEEITFSELEKGAAGREVVTDWILEKEVQPVACALNDFDFTKPKSSLLVSSSVTRSHGGAVYEIYDYPGEYLTSGDGDHLAGVRLAEWQTRYETTRGQSSARGLAAGFLFKLKSHPRADQNRDYLITGVSLHVDAGEYASTAAGQGGGEFFSCSFTAIDKTQQFRPSRLTPKPIVQGPQTAIVVGKSGEEIDTDLYGRVKVMFHWDRYAKADENSSCWIRVSQAWAGKNWGAIYTPRIGQEVIVSFLEGDPDQPIITGRVYNAGAMPPYALPDEKTKSTLKSSSSKGGAGFNEIRFEDKKGEEQIFLHAEKDEDVRVKNDAREWIGNEQHLIVKKDQLEKVEGNKHSLVKGNHLTKIEGDHGETTKGDHHAEIDGADHLTVKGDQCAKVSGDASFKTEKNWNNEAGQKISIKSGTDINGKAGMNYAMDAGMNVHIKGGMTVVIEAGMQLSLKAGSNFIDIGPSGVSISGTPMVMINSGGSAGSGGGSSPTAPTAPEAPDPPKEAKEAADDKAGEKDEPPPAPKPPKPKTFSDSAKVLKYAAQDGTPFCEECARAAEQEAKEEEEPVITSIAWLDGADDKEVADAIQWVNLPQDAKWVDKDNDVPNKDRLGQKPRFKVAFSKPGRHGFKVKAEAGEDNADYTDPEKGRNAKFKWQDKEKEYTTDGDGTKIVAADFFTTCAGLDQFQLVAEDKNNNPSVATGWLTTKRLAYLVVIKMKGMASAASLDSMEGEFSSHGIEIIDLPAVEIDRMANIGTTEEATFKTKCKTAFDGSDGKKKSPYAVAIAFTEHLAVKNPNQTLELPSVTVGPGEDPVDIPVMARGLRAGDGMGTRHLWKDLVAGESWFVSATYVPDGGGSNANIIEASCTALPLGASACATVRVDVTGLPVGTGTIRLKVNVVDRMRGGLSFPDGNLICICTKAWWEDIDAAEQNTTATHEMGHKVGMVSDGTGKLPDKVTTLYNGKGHVGNHCHFDLPVQASYAGVSGNKCVMYGAVGTGTTSAFCENCAPAVRKMDLSAGWPAS